MGNFDANGFIKKQMKRNEMRKYIKEAVKDEVAAKKAEPQNPPKALKYMW